MTLDVVNADNQKVGSLEMSDTLALSAIVDGVVVVARLKAARRPLLRQARQVLEGVPAAKLGIVVTGADQEKTYWYDRGNYYYAAGSGSVPPAGQPEPAATRRA